MNNFSCILDMRRKIKKNLCFAHLAQSGNHGAFAVEKK